MSVSASSDFSLLFKMLLKLPPPKQVLKRIPSSGARPKSNMPSRTLLSQDDFNCLGLAAGHDVDCQPLDGWAIMGSQPLHDCHGFTAVERPASIDSLKTESACKADEIYHPVNFFPDEVYELIRNWDLTFRKQLELKQTVISMSDMEAFTDSSKSDLDPMRCASVVHPPPKRFYRTFWRSVTRRILQLEKQSALDRAAPTTARAS